MPFVKNYQVTGPYGRSDEDLYECCPRCCSPIPRAKQARETAAALTAGIEGMVAGTPTTAEQVAEHSPALCDAMLALWRERDAADERDLPRGYP